MNGPEHYREAERLLREAQEPGIGMIADRWVAEAQVHATLALAHATAGGHYGLWAQKDQWESHFAKEEPA